LAAGADAVEVAVDEQTEKVGWVVRWAPQVIGNGMGETQLLQIEGSHEGVDEADGVLLADVVIEGFREEGHLVPIHTFDMAHLASPSGHGGEHDLPYTTPGFSHSLSLKLTRRAGP
jgi:hypothetical protein